MGDEQRFLAIRRRYEAARERERTYREEVLRPKHGRTDPPSSWLTITENDRLKAFSLAHERQADAMMALLADISPRDWSDSAPFYWIMTALTFEDAVTTGELSVLPPTPRGHTERDTRRFAAALG